MTIFLNVPESG